MYVEITVKCLKTFYTIFFQVNDVTKCACWKFRILLFSNVANLIISFDLNFIKTYFFGIFLNYICYTVCKYMVNSK